MPTESEIRSRRDSWPPTQLRLVPVDMQPKADDEPRPLLDIDDDPLTYFLTPTPDFEDEDGDIDMGFDAGIEDPSKPKEIVRSVSPSTLDGLRKPGLRRSPSPDLIDSGLATPPDDDDEDYIRFTPRFLSLRDFADARPQSPVFGKSANALLSPASFPAPLPRGRGRGSRRPRTRSMSLGRGNRPAHLWREPSPDVWSIEEETEEETMMSEMSDGAGSQRGGDGLEMRASKPKKKVRFVLPAGHP